MPLTEQSALRKDERTGASVRMEHRHFAFIAAVIAGLPDDINRGVVAADFVAALRRTNPRFDTQRFLRACGA